MVQLLRANGIVVPIKPKSKSSSVTAKHIRNLVGGVFYLVPLDQKRIMLVQGDPHKKTNQPINHKATSLFQRSIDIRRAPANEHPVIRGDVLVAEYEDLELSELKNPPMF